MQNITMIEWLGLCSLAVLIHELGHYIMAKLVGFKVSEFNMGVGPTLFKFKFRETIVSLKLITFGGSIRVDCKPELFTKPEIRKFMAVTLAGPAIESVLGMGLIYYNLFPYFALVLVLGGILNMIPFGGSDGMQFVRGIFQLSKKSE